jgi:hypothetical protein
VYKVKDYFPHDELQGGQWQKKNLEKR